MDEAWLDIKIGGVTARADLAPGLTRLGGPGANVVVPGAPEGELHLWSDPPKLVHVSGATPLEVAGARQAEVPLRDGLEVVWGPLTLVYRVHALVEEIPLEEHVAAPRVALAPSDDRAGARARAGMAIELGLADKNAVRRWQDAVVRGDFDADACAREVLAGTNLAADDPRLVERSGRLLRDFLMSSLQRGVKGASRKVRAQVKSGTAYVVANVIAIGVYTAIVLVVMVLLRLKGISFDELFDLVLGKEPPGA
ncbi:MAG: hypothetical protein H6828_13805 [Planctomycetes bacterium]|nr:hypothetical protein [Planctomycetota bacterium]